VRDVFDLSASANLIAPSLSENETISLPQRSSEHSFLSSKLVKTSLENIAENSVG
jgi:hypothetical protein